MNREPYPEVAEAANPCTADAPKLDGVQEDSHGDLRKNKPKETEATEQASSAEPVEARIEAYGGIYGDGLMTIDTALEAVSIDLQSRYWKDMTTLRERLLAREVKTLRDELAIYKAQRAQDIAEVRRLREERDLFRAASEAAELRIVELREQVTLMGAALKQQDEELKRLRDEPQPEREPKLPYNGY